MSQQSGSDGYLWYLWFQVLRQLWDLFTGTIRQFCALFMIDPTRAGPGYHFLSSFLAISVMSGIWAVIVDASDSADPWVVHSIQALVWQRAWVFHRNRDPRLPRRYLGRLHPWILGVIELLPIPDWMLGEVAQSRYWMPSILYLGGKGMAAWLCPATGALMQFCGIVLAIPAIWSALRESARRRRFEGMIQSVGNSLAPSEFTPVAGQRGRWAKEHVQHFGDWCQGLTTNQTELVLCPTCNGELECDSIVSNTLVSCPCGQQFQLLR